MKRRVKVEIRWRAELNAFAAWDPAKKVWLPAYEQLYYGDVAKAQSALGDDAAEAVKTVGNDPNVLAVGWVTVDDGS